MCQDRRVHGLRGTARKGPATAGTSKLQFVSGVGMALGALGGAVSGGDRVRKQNFED